MKRSDIEKKAAFYADSQVSIRGCGSAEWESKAYIRGCEDTLRWIYEKIHYTPISLANIQQLCHVEEDRK